MVPRGAEGGNSLLLRAISSQNKNISFPRKSQINIGFAWSGFYLPKKCYFLTHFVYGMKDGSRELSKMSFMHAHTHPISLYCRFLSCSLCLVVSHTHTHTQTNTDIVHLYICSAYTCKGFSFPHVCGIKGAFGVWWLTLDAPGWRHRIVVSGFHINGVFTSFDKPIQDTRTI